LDHTFSHDGRPAHNQIAQITITTSLFAIHIKEKNNVDAGVVSPPQPPTTPYRSSLIAAAAAEEPGHGWKGVCPPRCCTTNGSAIGAASIHHRKRKATTAHDLREQRKISEVELQSSRKQYYHIE